MIVFGDKTNFFDQINDATWGDLAEQVWPACYSELIYTDCIPRPSTKRRKHQARKYWVEKALRKKAMSGETTKEESTEWRKPEERKQWVEKTLRKKALSGESIKKAMSGESTKEESAEWREH